MNWYLPSFLLTLPCYSIYWSTRPLRLIANELKYLASSEAMRWMLFGRRSGAGDPTDLTRSAAPPIVAD